MKRSKVRMIRFAVGLLLIGGGIWAVFFADWGHEEPEPPPPVRPLKLFTVGETESNRVRRYPGSIAAVERVTMAFQVSGTLIELPIRKGREVEKGDLLAKLDPRDFENELASARGVLEGVQTQLERIERAARTGAVSQADLTTAQAAFEKAQADFEIAKKALEDTELRAPFDGVVANVFVDNFQSIQAKQEIVTVQKSEDLLIEVNVPEERIIHIDRAQERNHFTAVFDSLPNREFEVELYEYALEADPVSQTYQITFSMPSPDDVIILPGMTVTILEHPADPVEGNGDRPILVPVEAVSTDKSEQKYVWIVSEEAEGVTVVTRREVEVGQIEGDLIEIQSGLSAGERIAAVGVHLLREGQKIRPFIPKSRQEEPQ